MPFLPLPFPWQAGDQTLVFLLANCIDAMACLFPTNYRANVNNCPAS